MLNAQEKQQMQRDVKDVIISFGKMMTVFRKTEQSVGSFAGSYRSDEITIGEVAVEQKLLSPKSLTEVGADLVIVCGSETDISEGDRVEIDQPAPDQSGGPAGRNSYIASHINPQNAFGTVTHLEVNLEKDESQ